MERAEKIGLGIATAGHVLLFGALSMSFLHPPKPFKLNNPPIDVSIVDEVALRSAAPKITTEPPPPTQAPEIGPEEQAAPAPKSVPEPVPTPTPKTLPKTLPKPLPAKAPSPKALPKVVAPAPPKKREPTTTQPAKAAPAKPKSASASGKAAQTRGSRLGPDFLKGIQVENAPPAKATAAMPAAIIGPAQKAALDAEIRRQIKPHWKSPTGADVEQLRTSVAVTLNKDGSLKDEPAIRGTTGQTPSNQGQVRLHQEQAIRAIKLAAPFRLPPDLYNGGWESLIISFDKRLSL